MKIILYNTIIEKTISIFIVLATFSSLHLSMIDLKNKLKSSNDNEEIVNRNISKIEFIKRCIMAVYFLIFWILIAKYLINNNLSSYLSMVYYSYTLILVFKFRRRKMVELTSKNKIHYCMALLLILTLFCREITIIYIKLCTNLNHIAKEYMLLTYMFLKIISYISCIIISVSLVFSNIRIIYKRTFSKVKKMFMIFLKKEYEIDLDKTYFCNSKSRAYVIMDIIMYTITCPIYVIYCLFKYITIKITKKIIKFLFVIDKHILSYLKNTSILINKVFKTSLILSLVIVFIIVIYNQNTFSNQTTEIYSLITTVLLIPYIYDSITAK